MCKILSVSRSGFYRWKKRPISKRDMSNYKLLFYISEKTVTGSIDMAKRCETPNLALVHIQRRVRGQVIDRMQQFIHLAGSLNVMVPKPGYRITL